MIRLSRCMLMLAACAMMVVTTTAVAVTQTDAASTVRFGRPAWPGVTIKVEIAAQILDSLGYATNVKQLAPSIILNGIAHDQLDVYLAAWTPMESPMIDPLVADGEITKLVANMAEEVVQGIAVPTYVWDAGIHTVADMVAHADKFDHRIYGIEVGSGFNVTVKKAIQHDKANLGDWDLVASSTAAMLAQVTHSTNKHEWIAFSGWRPHWMNIKFSMKYLKDSGHSGTSRIKSVVYTITRPDYADKNPNLGRFFTQMTIPANVQSHWIYSFSYEKKEAEIIARNWIKSNLDIVSRWLEGVTTIDGKPAMKAVKSDIG